MALFKKKQKEWIPTVGLVSLGCSKNQVDAELMLAKLSRAGYEISDDVAGCDAVIVNTCGFIEDAKREAIDSILEMAGYKEDGDVKKIIVTGCLAERYRDEILAEFPEVDAVVGLGKNNDIVRVVDNVLDNETVPDPFPDKTELPLSGDRIRTTPEYWAYLKIAEGCSNNCAFCAIPAIRGKYRSRPMEDILEEARQLAKTGVKEVILIAQDTSLYGRDLYGELKLPQLLRELCQIPELRWIRFLYCYPERITDDLLDVLAEEEKVCSYLDIPLQHADQTVLRRMHRIGSRDQFAELIAHIRERVPDICLRTTVMTGFPGETDEQFETLAEFIKDMKFDNLGCFAFSAEEGTAAAVMEDQVPEDIRLHRQELIMQLQHDIVVENNKKHLGRTMDVLVDGYDKYSDSYIGRTSQQVPEVDGTVVFTCDRDLSAGTFVPVDIFGVEEYDITGQAF